MKASYSMRKVKDQNIVENSCCFNLQSHADKKKNNDWWTKFDNLRKYYKGGSWREPEVGVDDELTPIPGLVQEIET